MADPPTFPLLPNKLPIKRKHTLSPLPPPPPPPSHQHQQQQVLLQQQLQQQQPPPPNNPPFKFQRIWPEADETRLLQGLLDSAADGLSFPRDLSRFYDRFSTTTAHPYTKAQLSEKLRRLRKKFHALSARLSRGLNSAHLTPHDRSLFHLSKQLWHPSFAASSPFSAPILHHHRTLQANPARPPSLQHRRAEPVKEEEQGEEEEENPGSSSPPPPSEVRQWDRKKEKIGSLPSGGLGGMVAKAVMDVFDGALEEVKAALAVDTAPSSSSSASSTSNDLEGRWREQRALEFDALSRRLKLVLERSLHQ